MYRTLEDPSKIPSPSHSCFTINLASPFTYIYNCVYESLSSPSIKDFTSICIWKKRQCYISFVDNGIYRTYFAYIFL
ncbi:hypothetical protein M413DRAFT_113892 [Hebeloma cylindrosporum]|uniref:Uncharacterized protein n=1 Tax=Hebeloma cylindrosporum TaxID=76867 RepID=A0A0C2YIT2_HEBCY|nr:hypothetical protein M413DRAFT_113892 [Hebeloma cylindrosporum h7]